jgi:psiF repeat-containing protein
MPRGRADDTCTHRGVARHAGVGNTRHPEPPRSGVGETCNLKQQRMADCNKQAGAKKLEGDARKKFMSSCLKGQPDKG